VIRYVSSNCSKLSLIGGYTIAAATDVRTCVRRRGGYSSSSFVADRPPVAGLDLCVTDVGDDAVQVAQQSERPLVAQPRRTLPDRSVSTPLSLTVF